MLRRQTARGRYRKKRLPDSRSEQGFPAANRPMLVNAVVLGQVAPSTQMDGNRLTRSYNPEGSGSVDDGTVACRRQNLLQTVPVTARRVAASNCLCVVLRIIVASLLFSSALTAVEPDRRFCSGSARRRVSGLHNRTELSAGSILLYEQQNSPKHVRLSPAGNPAIRRSLLVRSPSPQLSLGGTIPPRRTDQRFFPEERNSCVG